jgi:hypothetical protein
MAAAPPPTAVTSALVVAARKEGKVSFYTALELNTAERLSRMFEAKYPGIAVGVERSGAERIFQRIAQEQGSGINAVDVANSAPTPHTISFKTKGRKQAGPSSKSWSSTPRFDCPVFGNSFLYDAPKTLRRILRGFVLLAFPNEPDAPSLSLLVWAIPVSRHKWI